MAVTLRFDGFVLDPETGELRKEGALVKLKPQPTQVLALLAGRRGAVVTRDEIQNALWPDETYVDFDLGINSCIRQIRIALGDEAEAPRYIQTISKRGYRLLAPLEPEQEVVEGEANATNVLDRGAGFAGNPLVTSRAGWKRALPWSVAVVSALAAGVATLRHDVSREAPVVRAEISAPSGTRYHLLSADPGPPVLSPDGRRLAFSARDAEGNVKLYVRSLENVEARVLSGTDQAQYPFWSPDGRWLGFFADGKLKKIETDGETTPLTVCDAENGKGGTWNQDDVIVFALQAPVHSTACRPKAVGRCPSPSSTKDGATTRTGIHGFYRTADAFCISQGTSQAPHTMS